ncbi:restriction endonuclease subunit S [Neptunomonas qingdaonensis]|uniref:Type I restriction enzyme, S subunit n=1 Tax=Neptunomonas qingdaonensis TaxID=1045558 RepID=A0A1I2RCL4_9GAMM|nr:restriction endonuclease subunit S [Neptunomonas qingdaonensis]SFG37219.1 type I restriction enzyme, S subunit [Neptunomonas qingdaonensis]
MSDTVPEGWKSHKLNTITNVIDSAHQTPSFSESGYPMVRIGDIKGGKLTLENTALVSKEVFKAFTKKYAPTHNDLLMTRVGSYGRCSIVKAKQAFCLGQNTVVINPISIDPDYLYHFLQTRNINEQIEDTVGGSSQKSLSLSAIMNLKVLTPDKCEQKKIAAILTSADDVIDKTQAQINKLKDLKTGMMQELLTKGIGHTEFKDSPVGIIPKEWEVFTSQELLKKGILEKLQDGNHGSQYPRAQEFLKEGVPYIAASHISELGEINFKVCPHLSQQSADQMRIRPAIGGDVILTHNATIGRTAIIPQEKSEVIASTSTTYYRTDPNKLLNKYLFYYFQSTAFVSQLQSVMGQTTRNQVPITAQRELDIILPTFKEQIAISNVIESITDRIKAISAKHKQLIKTKKALMQDLLTGKVRVNVDS